MPRACDAIRNFRGRTKACFFILSTSSRNFFALSIPGNRANSVFPSYRVTRLCTQFRRRLRRNTNVVFLSSFHTRFIVVIVLNAARRIRHSLVEQLFFNRSPRVSELNRRRFRDGKTKLGLEKMCRTGKTFYRIATIVCYRFSKRQCRIRMYTLQKKKTVWLSNAPKRSIFRETGGDTTYRN